MKFSFSCLFFIVPFCLIVQAQDPIMFIYDGSGSMWGEMESRTKHEIAKDVLLSTIDSFDPNQGIGLVAYGHRHEKDCNDVEELISLNSVNRKELVNVINTIKPKGRTPLARSASMVLNRIQKDNVKATIILITDGIESCDGNICDVVKEAKESGVEFKLHIVGFGIDGDDISQLQCAAMNSGGEYFDASNSDKLREYIKAATDKRVDSPDPNSSFYTSRNGEGIDAIIDFYNINGGEKLQSVRTYGREVMAFVLPGRYQLEIKALENSDLTSLNVGDIRISESDDNEFSFSFDSGNLSIVLTNNQTEWDGLVHVFNRKTGKKQSSGRTYGRVKSFELDPGLYSLELKPMKINGVVDVFVLDSILVEANETNELKYNFNSVELNLEVLNGSDLVDATVQIFDASQNKYVTGGRTYTSTSSNPKTFLLLPSEYVVKITPIDNSIGSETELTLDMREEKSYSETINF